MRETKSLTPRGTHFRMIYSINMEVDTDLDPDPPPDPPPDDIPLEEMDIPLPSPASELGVSKG